MKLYGEENFGDMEKKSAPPREEMINTKSNKVKVNSEKVMTFEVVLRRAETARDRASD